VTSNFSSMVKVMISLVDISRALNERYYAQKQARIVSIFIVDAALPCLLPM